LIDGCTIDLRIWIKGFREELIDDVLDLFGITNLGFNQIDGAIN